jgi:hypothetical protein
MEQVIIKIRLKLRTMWMSIRTIYGLVQLPNADVTTQEVADILRSPRRWRVQKTARVLEALLDGKRSDVRYLT